MSVQWNAIKMSMISMAVNWFWAPVICQLIFEGNIETLKVKHNKIFVKMSKCNGRARPRYYI